jgi:hypothetical protein
VVKKRKKVEKAEKVSKARSVELEEVLKDPSLVVILAYAPAGLGHLRVTDALYEGLSEGVGPLLLGAHDQTLGAIHRIVSVNLLTRKVMEWVQQGAPEDIFTYPYRNWLRSKPRTKLIYEQVTTILEQRVELPKKVLVVCTHFGLAHQLAAIKRKLEKDKGVEVTLVVVVTDDSPLHIWYVPGADLTFVPSGLTRRKLKEYGKKMALDKVKIKVRPYPVNLKLATKLSVKEGQERMRQLKGKGNDQIRVCVPISGAAVGLKYYLKLMQAMSEQSGRFEFEVVSKTAVYTHKFLGRMLEKKRVNMHVSAHDREVVDKYEKLYEEKVVGLEITKPSEQAFKALLSPEQRGGSVLLLSRPVGRQEWDNLDFLRRHELIPWRSEQMKIWQLADEGLRGNRETVKEWKRKARCWRGIRLPNEPERAAQFVWWAIEQGLFSEMMRCGQRLGKGKVGKRELGDDGVKLIWEEVARELSR